MKPEERSRRILKNLCGLYLMRILGSAIMSQFPSSQIFNVSHLFDVHS